MKYINKFNKTSDYNAAIEENGALYNLKHYLAYDAESKKMFIKEQPKPQPKTMKFVLTENELQYAQNSGGQLPLICRKDLFKSIKYNGEELLTEPTVDPIKWEDPETHEPIDDLFVRINYMFDILMPSGYNTNYFILTTDILGDGEISPNTEILLEVEFKDNLTDLSLFNVVTLGLTEISSNLFEDCTKVTDFSGCLINQFYEMLEIPNPLVSSCPIDKDGTPIYNRSGKGKEGYAIVDKYIWCFGNCVNVKDYDEIPITWGGNNDNGCKIILNCDNVNTTSFIERLENGETIRHYLFPGKNAFNDAPYGFRILNEAPSASSAITTSLLSIVFNDYDTSKVTDMNKMFRDCEKLTNLDLSSFNTSNVTNMDNMFSWCFNLTSLDLSNFNTTNVTNMSYMFNNCGKLTHIKCKQQFKDWCITNQYTISLPSAMKEGGSGTWEIVE